MKREKNRRQEHEERVDQQLAISVATPVVAGFEVSISGRFSAVHRGLVRLLGDLQDQHRIIPADGTFQYIAAGDAVLVPLEDLNNRDRRLYLYFWTRTSDAFFLQIEGTLRTGGEVHLWSGTTEILINGNTARQLVTPSNHAFRARQSVSAISTPADALACIARSAGISLEAVNLTNVLGLLNGSCVAANVTNLALTAYACLTPPEGVLGCLAGIAQIIACGLANCAATCSGPPGAPTGLSATVSANTVSLRWSAPSSGSPTSYVIEAGSSPGSSNLSVTDTGSTATSLVTSNISSATYYVRVRAKNACGTSSPSNERTVLVIPFSSDVQVSVSWDARSDVDLHVIDPAGEEIYWGHPTSRSGGQLDIDSNAGCTIDARNIENIRWSSRAPAGTYVVRVDYWSSCDVTQTNYVVTVKNGSVTQVFTGGFTGSGDRGGAGSGRLITSFVHSAGPTTNQIPESARPQDLFVPSPEKLRESVDISSQR